MGAAQTPIQAYLAQRKYQNDDAGVRDGSKYTYDELGERTKTTPTTGVATTYKYDQAGNLTSVERPKENKGAAEIKDTYTYNGDGLRVSQTIGRNNLVLHMGHE